MTMLRSSIVAGLLLMSATVFAQATRHVDVPAGDLAGALRALAEQAGVELIYQTDQLKGLETAGVKGEFEVAEAVRRLISGTDLTLRIDAGGAISIVSGHAANAQTAVVGQEGVVGRAGANLEEVVVTAQKRAQRLQDVPVPVTAITGESLVNSNKLRLKDYFSSVPGLSLTPGLQSTQALSIRGISTGSTFNPTVGITIDDVPYGASAANAGGNLVPDIDPSDLASLEVLRGPQGTLYGASSMGGLLKFVTIDPSTDEMSGRVQAGTSHVRNGDGLSYNVRGSVNVPLGDTFAVRASGFTRRDAGYIDNVLSGKRGNNRADVDGGRISALWRPSSTFSLKLSALAQQTEVVGLSSVSKAPQLTDLQQSYILGAGAGDSKLEAYSATLNAKLGGLELTSVSGYNVNEPADSLDVSAFFGDGSAALYGVTGAVAREQLVFKKFTQELRLSGPLGPRVDFLLGAFYTHEKSRWQQDIDAVEATQGTIVGNLISDVFPTMFQEYAAFANLTLHVTDRFDLQVGGRQSEIKQTFTDTQIGPYLELLGVPVPLVTPKESVRTDAFTYLLTPSFKITPDLMLYARFASGYRAGGVNSAFNAPPKYNPDKTQNYELGLKGDFFDRAVAVDASVYYIEWKDIQVPQNDYVANAPQAKSQGVELSVELRPFDGLRVAAWVVWSDAQLTKDFPPDSFTIGRSGDSLPGSSRFSGNLSVQQDFPLGIGVDGFVGASIGYMGARKGEFWESAERQKLAGYAKVDLIGGATFGTWSINLFINNATDKRGVLSGGAGNFLDPTGFYYIAPRTAGMSIVKTF